MSGRTVSIAEREARLAAAVERQRIAQMRLLPRERSPAGYLLPQGYSESSQHKRDAYKRRLAFENKQRTKLGQELLPEGTQLSHKDFENLRQQRVCAKAIKDEAVHGKRRFTPSGTLVPLVRPRKSRAKPKVAKGEPTIEKIEN